MELLLDGTHACCHTPRLLSTNAHESRCNLDAVTGTEFE